MTTPTTQREADERTLPTLPEPERHNFGVYAYTAEQMRGYARAAIDQSTRQAAPEASAIARDWPEDAAHENGNYQCRCSTCGNTFIGYKRRITCKACAHPAATDQPSSGSGQKSTEAES